MMSEGEEQPYQVMPDLTDEKYERLKEDIEQNGLEYPILVDDEKPEGVTFDRWIRELIDAERE